MCLSEVWGGIEKNVVVRAAELKKRGYSTAVVVLENTFEHRYREKGIEVFTVPPGARFRLKTRVAMAKLLKTVRPRSVFVAVKADWWLVAAPAYRLGVQSIVLYLGIHRRLKENIKYWFLFKVFKAKLVVNSTSLLESVREGNKFLSDANVCLIHNGFKPAVVSQSAQLEGFPKLPTDAFVIGCAGRLAPTKQYEQLADILPLLPKNVHVLLVGEGEERANIKNRLTEAGVQERVHFLGQLPYESMPAFFQQLNLFLHISRLEGMANVLNEALSNGVPVVSTRVSGSEEVTQNGRFGIICEINDVEGIASAVMDVYQGHFKFNSVEAQQWIQESFSMKKMLNKTEEILFPSQQ